MSLKSQEQRRIRRRSSRESPAPVLSRHPAAGHAELLRYTELSFRDPYPALHINCNQDMIKQGQPQACYLEILELLFALNKKIPKRGANVKE